MSMLMPRVSFIRNQIVQLGPLLQDLLEHLGPSNATVMPSLSWNTLIGRLDGLRVTREMLRGELRASFTWKHTLFLAAFLLARLRQARLDSRERREVARFALSDDWPAALDAPDRLLDFLAAQNRHPVTVSEQGLLALVADALVDPWPDPKAHLAGISAQRRFARLVMLASELLDERDAETLPEMIYTSEVLLPLGRLREGDTPLRALVRSHELYLECLVKHVPDAEARLHAAVGVDPGAWIGDVAAIVTMAEEALAPAGGHDPILDLRRASASAPARSLDRVRAVAASLSEDADGYKRALIELRDRKVNAGLRFQPMRARPLLRIEENVYLFLHVDFVLAGADERLYYALLDSFPAGERGGFLARLGDAFEEYAGRVLRRCEAACSGSRLFRIQPSSERGRKRCDWAWLVGDSLILVDAKRLGVPADWLMGVDVTSRLRERLEKEGGEVFEQFLHTTEDIERLGVEAVIPGLAGAYARVYAWVVHHRPLFVWFDASTRLVERTVGLERWRARFAARPAFFSSAELELIEAALPSFDLGAFLRARQAEHPSTLLGVEHYLSDIGWKGPYASEYYRDRTRALLLSRDGGPA